MFHSAKDPNVLAFTIDPQGENLPDEFAPWQAKGRQVLPTGQVLAGVGQADDVISALQRDGFYLVKSGPTATHSGPIPTGRP
jgi:hypothetical protein